MKKIISILIVLISLSTYSQTEVHNQKVKIKTTPQGSKSDSLIVKGTDNILKYLSRTDFLNGVSSGSGSNYYLNGITKSGNTLTFAVNGTTNQTYEFGSNAFTSFSDHALENYLKSADLTDYATQLWVSNQGYLTSFTETDPIYTAWDKSTGISITESQISDLNHTVDTNTQLSDSDIANFGYIKNFTEIDGSVTNELQNGSEILLTGYTKPASFTSVLSSDTVNEAIGKLEKGLEDATSGGVTSVNGQTGAAVLNADDISDSSTTNKYVTSSQIANFHAPGSDDQDLTPYITFANANAAFEPIKGADDNFVTDAEKIVIGNTSGINTGDQDFDVTIDGNYLTTIDKNTNLNLLSGSGIALESFSSHLGNSLVIRSTFSNSYNDLYDTPTIPTNNNQLTNGAGYALDSEVIHNTGNEDVYGIKTIKDDLTLDSDLIVDGQSFFNDSTLFNGGTAGISFTDLENKPQLSISGNTLSLTGSTPVTLPSGASNVNADWNATSGDALILNKPTIPTNNNQITNGAGYALDNGVVHDTGNEDVHGVKSFHDYTVFKDDVRLENSTGQTRLFISDSKIEYTYAQNGNQRMRYLPYAIDYLGTNASGENGTPTRILINNTGVGANITFREQSGTVALLSDIPTSSGGSSGTNTTFIQGAGRVLMATDNRWITDSDDIYGFNKEEFTDAAGTGSEPNIKWQTRGVPIPPNYRVKKIHLIGRTNSTQITNIDIRVYKRERSSGGSNQGVDNNSEMNNTQIYSGQWFDSGTTYTGDSNDSFDKQITTSIHNSSASLSQVTMYFRPVGTLSSTRYFYMSYTMELEYIVNVD